ncbi:MAG: hypothetical protein AAGC45_02860 [Bacteroidota bacterium]
MKRFQFSPLSGILSDAKYEPGFNGSKSNVEVCVKENRVMVLDSSA